MVAALLGTAHDGARTYLDPVTEVVARWRASPFFRMLQTGESLLRRRVAASPATVPTTASATIPAVVRCACAAKRPEPASPPVPDDTVIFLPAGEAPDGPPDELLRAAALVDVGGVPEVHTQLGGLPEERRRSLLAEGPRVHAGRGIAQDRASSVIYGMPAAAAKIADEVLPLDVIHLGIEREVDRRAAIPAIAASASTEAP